MGLVLSVYSKEAFKEYLLPVAEDGDFSITVEAKLFGLKKDERIDLLVSDSKWHIMLESEQYEIKYVESSREYQEDILNNQDTLLLTFNSGEQLSIIVNERKNVFNVFEKYYIPNNSSFTVGRGESSDIVYESKTPISRKHAVVTKSAEGYLIENTSSNGTFKNGKLINGTAKLEFGDCVDIFGLRLVFLGNIFALNANIEGLTINENKLKKYIQTNSTETENKKVKKNREKDLFHRSPRNIEPIDSEPVEIEAPPAPKELVQQPTFMAIGPSLTMALPMLMGCTLSIYSSRMNGGHSSVFMYTGLVTAVGSSIIGAVWSIVNMRQARLKKRAEENKRFKAYSEYLIEMANKVKDKYDNNTRAMTNMYPASGTVVNYNKESLELWNRNYRHEDFLAERLGIGNVPFQADIIIPREKFKLINDSLAEKPKLIKESYKYLQNVPVVIDLNANKLIGIIGGDAKQGCYQIMHNLAAQIAANNCYTDVKMAFVYDETKDAAAESWQFARWLPHVWSEDKKTRYVAGNKADASEVFYEITKVLRMRAEEKENHLSRDQKIEKPYYVLFLESPSLLEGELISKYIYDTNSNMGITTIVMANSYEELPNSCEFIVENTNEYKGIYNVADGLDDRIDVAFDAVETNALEEFGRRLAKIEVKEEETSGEIPNALTFFEMYGVNHPYELNALDRWKKNRTYDSMKALIGQKSGGSNCYLDVHEKYHGPHGLVAGTTGSGKSETLQTYMLSLALNFSPDDVGFFVIDYKGGGMANLFENLPHMIGSISNLSGNQVRRAMVSIKSENKRRQRIFNEHGVNNINLYTRLYKNKEATIPVPHLFIIIDEFAELKREEPDFMRELVSVAQVGRSLGVHLILATQKPSGTVDDNIWSNSKFKLCLRVQDRQDSTDMLHKPDAAYITQAGRCYLQVGNDELYELFQSGWSGATYDKSAGTVQTNIAQMLAVNGKAALVGSHAKIKQKEIAKVAWIASLVEKIKVVAESLEAQVTECLSDNMLCNKMTAKVFELIENENIDYPYSEFNARRIDDLIIAYASSLNENSAIINWSKEEVATELINMAAKSNKKLPEMKEKTQLDAVIDYLADVAHANHYENDVKLWMPLLPTELYLEELEGYSEKTFDGKQWPAFGTGYSLSTIIGKYDDPANQDQQPITLDIAVDGNHAIVGTVVTGKSTFLMTYLYSLINRYSPDAVNIYILDYSSKMLGNLAAAPHVGGVMFEDDDEKVSKFFTLLLKILAERKKLFKGGSYSQYIQVNGLEYSTVVVAIDNIGAFRAKTENRYDDVMMTLLKEGLNYGILFVVTAAGFGMTEIPNRMSDNFRGTFCLEMNDQFAYSDILRTLHLEVHPEENVKGRGITKVGDSILEFQTALTIPAEDDFKRNEMIAQKCEEMAEAWDGKKARRIPEIPEKPVWKEFSRLDESTMLAKEGIRMPVGYDRRDASVYGIDLANTYCYTISGRSRSGKTNMLKAAIKSAALMGGDIYVIDMNGELKQVADSVNAKYISNSREMYEFMVNDLKPNFIQRNGVKKSYDAQGLSPEEKYEKMCEQFSRMFIFIWDLPQFITKVRRPEDGIEAMEPFITNLLDKGVSHNVFWFGCLSTEDKSKIAGENTFKLFTREGSGIHFGGKVDEVSYLPFDHLNYTQKSGSEKPGIGWLPTHETDTTKAVVVPQYKGE